MTRAKKAKPENTENATGTETQQSTTTVTKTHAPDVLFKIVTSETVVEMGLKLGPTERPIPASMRDDLLILVPEGVSVQNTIFDFFKPVNVVEFKSENDVTLDEREFLKNVIRVHALYIQDKILTVEQMLNVYVSSHRPINLIKFMQEHGYDFKGTEEREWLLAGQFGLVDVAIVICEKLPIEPKYYQWLLFAPTNSKTWHDFVVKLFKSGEQFSKLVEYVVSMRPKEASMIYQELEKMAKAGEIDREEFEKLDQERFDLLSVLFKDALETSPRSQDVTKLFVQTISPEQLADAYPHLTPEERAQLVKLLQKEPE